MPDANGMMGNRDALVNDEVRSLKRDKCKFFLQYIEHNVNA